MLGITPRQRLVLDFIREYLGKYGHSPSYEEIGAALNLSSLSTIHKHVKALKLRGHIDYVSGLSRSIIVK